MAQPWTVSETRFAEYLIVHGYEPERDVGWRLKFGVDTPKDPDFLVSRAAEILAICEVKEFTDTPLDRRLARARYATSSSAELYGSASDAIRDAAREQLRPFAGIGLPLASCSQTRTTRSSRSGPRRCRRRSSASRKRSSSTSVRATRRRRRTRGSSSADVVRSSTIVRRFERSTRTPTSLPSSYSALDERPMTTWTCCARSSDAGDPRTQMRTILRTSRLWSRRSQKQTRRGWCQAGSTSG